MFKTLKHASTRTALLATALFATATGAFAQTEAQKSAIRSACRSDFMAHCSSVTPGGVEAYQCLAKNMSSLSSGCQAAVRAVEPAAAPKTEAAPAKSEPAKSEPAKTEAAPAAAPASRPGTAAAPKAAAAKQLSPAQVSAIKSACRGDYPKVCASVPPGGAPALECLEKNKATVAERPRLLPLLHRPQRRRLPRLRPPSCCGHCCRAKSCSSCGQLAAPISARSAPAWRPAAAGSSNAFPTGRHRSRRPARRCSRLSRRDETERA